MKTERRTEPAWEPRGVTSDADPSARCERCGAATRWRHRFHDPEAGATLNVCRGCARKLVRGYDGEAEERAVIDRGKRLLMFLDEKHWHPSRKKPGNTVRRHLLPDNSAVLVTVFPTGEGEFGVSVSDGRSPVVYLNGFPDVTEAKSAAFGAVEEIGSRTPEARA